MALPPRPTLADLQADIAQLTKTRGWDQRALAELFLMFTEEVGELAKEVRYREGIQRDANRAEADLNGEIADVLIILMDLANRLDVDLESAFRAKRAITDRRRWDG